MVEKHIEIPVSFTDEDLEKLSKARENNKAIHFRFFEKQNELARDF